MTYTATTARMLYGMERNGTLPAILGRVHPKWGVPRPAMWVNLAVSFLFLFFFRGWGSLAAVISVATIISYLTGPVSVMTLRRTAPELSRPLRLSGLPLLAGVAFIMSTELLYWAKWPLTGEIILLMVVALPVYFYYQAKAGWHDFGRQMKGAWWLVCYLPTLAIVSWAGSTIFGGKGYLPYGWDLALVAVIGLAFYLWGVQSGWRTPSVEAARLEAHDDPDAPLVPPDEETAERVTGH
jgi:amino acid transporter